VGADVYNTVAMQTVAILGAGELGGLTARALACRNAVARIVLVDEAGAVAAGKALDILQSGPLEGFDTRLDGTSDIGTVAGASVIVLADAHGAGEWLRDEGLALVRRAHALSPRSVIVAAGAAQRDLLAACAAEGGVPVARLVGSAPVAASAAARALAALESNRAAPDISVTMVGAPPRWVAVWSAATAAGLPLADLLNAGQLARIDARLRASWPPGPYPLASAAAAVVQAIVTASNRRWCCFVADRARPGRPVFAALPAALGPEGVRSIDLPPLGPRERVALDEVLSG
jgi:malate dehydrogenase